MKVRQEVIVFAGAVLVLGWLAMDSFGRGADRRPRAGQRPTLERHAAPDLGITRALDRANARLTRPFFQEPSDTRPLPPLRFAEPPRQPLLALSAPPWPAPGPAHYAPHLWRSVRVEEIPGLFDVPETIAEAELPVAAALPAGQIATPSAAERAALAEGYKRIHDWIELVPGRPMFGRITNADRHGLFAPGREQEPVRFDEIVPETGRPRFPGQPPIAYERSRIVAFALADTPANRLEARFRDLDGDVRAATYPTALALAEDCLDAAFDVPRALAMAEALYVQCIAHDAEDPLPRVGLARRFELGQEFERAFEAHAELAKRFPHRGEVHAARGRLEARLLLDEQAERSFAEALRTDSGWNARLAFGEYLLARGRSAEALPLLEVAQRAAPQGPDDRDVRIAIRLALAAALAGEGRLDEAFEQHLAAWRGAPESQVALAGVVSLASLSSTRRASFTPPAWLAGDGAAQPEAMGFELLFAAGSWHAAHGRAAAARELFERAIAADPLRATAPLRALSALAELHGHPDHALSFVERALESDPRDPWSLLQRARLVVDRGDLDAAIQDLDAALAIEADFADAIAWRGELAWRRGEFAAADRYLERAQVLAPTRADIAELRALSLVEIDAFFDARELADKSAAQDENRFAARAVAAWCAYRTEDVGEALVRLGELEDSLRQVPETDPRREWVRRQITRLDEHRRRFAWTDAFERTRLENQWSVEDTVGQAVALEQGELVITGAFSRAGETRVWREYPAEEFVSIELDVFIEPGSAARTSVFLGRESGRAGPRQVQSQIAIARGRDGAAQARIVRSTTGEQDWFDLAASEFPEGRWVRVRIERDGDGADSTAGVALDGIPVLEAVRLPGLGRASTPLRVGIAVQGDTGRTARVRIDNVEVVRRTGT